MRPESRDALLTAIAKARGWVDDIRFGRTASFRREAIKRRDHSDEALAEISGSYNVSGGRFRD
jgi:hypothetical protein